MRARQSNFIPAAAPVLKALISQGFRLDDDLIRAVLAKTVQETWP